VDEALSRENMLRKYKGAKKDHTAQSLWRKYEQELTLLRTFAKKIPGIGNLAELQSGPKQIRHMTTVSSEYQTYTPCLFKRSLNWSKKILRETNYHNQHRDKSTWASESSRCHRLNMHHNPAPLGLLQCNNSTEHLYTILFERNEH